LLFAFRDPGLVTVSSGPGKSLGLVNMLFFRKLSLVFHVGFHNIKGIPAAGNHTVAWAPEMVAP